LIARAIRWLVTACIATLVIGALPGHAQVSVRPLSSSEERALNANRVGVVAGGPGGTYIRIANDLGLVLDDTTGYSLRVVAQTGRGSVRNILDLLHLERVDVAIVQDDVLDYVARLPSFANSGIRTKIAYVTKLYEEEIHILARGGIRKFEDLASKRVSIDVADSGTEMTARNLFATFDLSVKEVNMPLSEAVQALTDGRIDAFIFVGGKPLDTLARFQEAAVRAAGIGFVTLAHDNPLRAGYSRATLAAADYPALMSAGTQVETWSVSAVLAVFNWFQPHIVETHPRRRITSIFINSFMSNFQKFCTGFTSKWREVDLSLTQPNWIRAAPAARWLGANPKAQLRCVR
jgi:TRAP transporter TAXI family solute receptor